MDNLHLNHMPVAKTGMLIRQPVAKVFGAFVDPSIRPSFGLPRVVVDSK